MLTSDSALTASRSELRDRPRSAARSASLGSRSPACSVPERIIALIFSMASSVSATADLRKIRCLHRVSHGNLADSPRPSAATDTKDSMAANEIEAIQDGDTSLDLRDEAERCLRALAGPDARL